MPLDVGEWPKGKDVLGGLNALVSQLAGNARQAKKKGGVTSFHPALPAYLGGGGPGGWAYNHYAESKNVTGWTFCAVRAISRTCARAVVEILRVGRAARNVYKAAKKALKTMKMTEAEFREVCKSFTASQSGDDAVPVPREHPAHRLLRRPNPWMSRAQFLFQCAQQLTVTGSALLWTRRNNYGGRDRRGQPVRMYVIPTGLAAPLIPGDEMPAGAYRIMPVGSYGGANLDYDTFGDTSWTNLMLTGGVVDGRQVRPIRWPHPLFLTDGLSNMAAGELWIDMSNQLDRATWYGFKNTLRPGRVFSVGPDEEEPVGSEAERFEKELQAKVGGIENVGKSLWLPKGVQVVDKDPGVVDLDYVNGRKQAGDTVLALFSTPPIATGVQESGAYAAYFASLLQFTEQAIAPVLDLLGDELTHELSPAYGDPDDTEIHLKPPPVNDYQQKQSEWGLITQNRACTNNEFRQAFGLPPLDGRRGEWQVGTDWAEAGVEDFSIPPGTRPGSSGEPLDRTGAPPDNGGDQGEEPARPTDSGMKPRGKSLRVGRKRVGRNPDVPGYFRPAPPYIPSGLFAGTNGTNGTH